MKPCLIGTLVLVESLEFVGSPLNAKKTGKLAISQGYSVVP